MRNIILDGNKITSKQSLHSMLKSELKLPDYYGENLDALWDVLSEEIEEPLMITWQDFHKSKEYLGEYADRVIELFEDAKNEFEGFEFEIK
ncbi:MAG: barstar family protein [Ignavibacteriales bacterium]